MSELDSDFKLHQLKINRLQVGFETLRVHLVFSENDYILQIEVLSEFSSNNSQMFDLCLTYYDRCLINGLQMRFNAFLHLVTSRFFYLSSSFSIHFNCSLFHFLL